MERSVRAQTPSHCASRSTTSTRATPACLDEERFEEWPDFFADPCVYKIMPRINFERKLPLATWLCESHGYLRDRVTAIRKTSVYGPRYIRRFVSGIHIVCDRRRGNRGARQLSPPTRRYRTS